MISLDRMGDECGAVKWCLRDVMNPGGNQTSWRLEEGDLLWLGRMGKKIVDGPDETFNLEASLEQDPTFTELVNRFRITRPLFRVQSRPEAETSLQVA